MSQEPPSSTCSHTVRPISKLRFWTSEGLTQAESRFIRGWITGVRLSRGLSGLRKMFGILFVHHPPKGDPKRGIRKTKHLRD